MNLPKHFYQTRRLENIVENRTTYTVDSAELNIYETQHYAQEVILSFNQPVFASMISGKKVMHLRDQDSFDFYPGESILMPANELMKIDFPEATIKNPTECLAMTIAPEKIDHILEFLNINYPKSDHVDWRVSDHNFAFTNDPAIAQIIQRLTYLFIENHPSKDFFVEMMLRELIVRVMQNDNRASLSANNEVIYTKNRMAFVIRYIKENLQKPLSVKDLSDQVCMSESNFYRVFRDELGISPIQFINNERIKKAAELLKTRDMQIKEVYLLCGFNNISYFNRAFKKALNQTPGEYQSSFTLQHLN